MRKIFILLCACCLGSAVAQAQEFSAVNADGMTLYYSVTGEGEAEVYDWRPAVQSCVSNITALAERYGCPVMICETGMPYSEPDETYAMLAYLIGNAKATGYCSGVFYWEPEAPAGYNDGYLLGAFDDGMPTHALDAFTEASVR